MLTQYQTAFLSYMKEQLPEKYPASLYEPASYIMQLDGKRIRPVLALLAADAVGGSFKNALPAALAVEVFHNFSLVHDDIMDDAPLRRGRATVHEKWDANTGILSGDVMLIWAYECLNVYPGALFKELTSLFSATARKVCEGQQYDMDFPNQKLVTQKEYMQMIAYKTAVLLGCSLQMGALVGGASKETSLPFYNFGIELGLAFQLQDDYLDAFGDPETFGKQIGGDIIENKKTLLYLLALELGSPEDAAALERLFETNPTDPTQKIAQVKELFTTSGAVEQIQQQMKAYTQKALKEVDQFPVEEEKKEIFKAFALQLMDRKL
ncbi:MAG: polyprenyl synthetase family protein [Flavobacteriaceae bacterium]|nr:polyprenyl synthetase family protein [Flavobacteriaceae bacterium]